MTKRDIDSGLKRGRRGAGTPMHAQEVVDMWEAGITDISVMAVQTGNTRGQVALFLRQAGFEVYAGHLTLLDRYTDAEMEEMLGDYYERKMPIWEMCQKWDLADSASFYNIIRRLGRKPRRRSTEDMETRKMQIEEAVKLYDENLDMSIADISIETGVDTARINMEVRKRGITLRSKRRDDYVKAE